MLSSEEDGEPYRPGILWLRSPADSLPARRPIGLVGQRSAVPYFVSCPGPMPGSYTQNLWKGWSLIQPSQGGKEKGGDDETTVADGRRSAGCPRTPAPGSDG